MAKNIEHSCLRVTQPIGDFYISVFGAIDLLASVDIFRRELTGRDRDYVQRRLNGSRQKDIADYVTDPDATFPTSIIVATYDDVFVVDEKRNVIQLPEGARIGEVIDGQHRLEGLRRAIEEHGEEPFRDFQLPVVFMPGLQVADKAYVFSIINSTQKSVQSSLIADLFDLQTRRSMPKLAHDIAQTFNAKLGNPFYRGLKMLGRRNFEMEYLTQGSFVKYVLELLTKKPDRDMLVEKRGEKLDPDPQCPLRKLYIEKDDGLIAKILENYFSAIRDVFSEEWEKSPEKYVLRKTIGFSALIIAFKVVWDKEISKTGDATYDVFFQKAKEFQRNLGETSLTSNNFSSSGQEASKLARLLVGE